MKLKPLTQFICDECGEVIETPEQGWLEWLVVGGKKENFRIVHHMPASPRPNGCYHSEEGQHVQDYHLKQFMGTDGLAVLLSLLETRPVKDPLELADIIRRLHIPLYEEARQYWDAATSDGFFDGTNEIYPYVRSTLDDIIRRYGP